MLLEFFTFCISTRIVLAARHTVDGKLPFNSTPVNCSDLQTNRKYHQGIRDFTLLVPRRILSNGEFKSFQVNQYFEHDLLPSRIQKRSLDDPELTHYGVWLEEDLQQLDLWPNREFLNPNFVFERRDDSPVYKRQLENLSGKKLCYYTGKVRGFDDSTAALSTCDGLLGHIRIEDTDYFIEPVAKHGPNNEGQHLHVIYDLTKKMYRKKRSSFNKSGCAVHDEESEWENEIEKRIRDSYNAINNIKNKKKESLRPKYMETTMVCDKSFVQFHQGHRDLDVYMLTAANTAFNAFRDVSFGSDLILSLVRVIYLEKEEHEIDLNVTVSIEDTLASFNKFAERINFPEGNPLHHDVAMLGSRVDMCSGAKLEDCVVCGIAKIGGACKANSSANVAEDDGVYELAMTLTHEAGHLLGITHDGAEGLGKPCQNPNKTAIGPERTKVWIMSVVDPNDVYLGWSECSRAMSAAFIRNGWADCMNDQPEKTNKKFNQIPIGSLYNRNEQCYLSTIRKGKELEANKTCGDPSECKNLYCQYYGDNMGCKTLNHMVADGTRCGEDKWCWDSQCVSKGQRPNSIDGGWSDWNGWSDCTRTCGGGVQINKRSCNQPRQANGGRYCQGDAQQIKLCNLEPCEESTRNKVCRKQFKGVGLFIQKNPCQIPCLTLKDKVVWSNLTVPDGESCVWGKKPKKRCISGECLKIGCDDEIESSAVLDECNVCTGDGTSCTVIEGRFKHKKGNGPRTQLVTTFPKGAFNIKIREATAYESKISILGADPKTVYINDYEGEKTFPSLEGPKELKNGIMGYLSINGMVENFTIEGPTKEQLTFKVVYLSEDADFKWKYSFVFGNETAPKEDRAYRWEQNDWTECSKVCGGGIQTSTFNCIEDKLGKVSDSLCKGLIDVPDAESKACKEQPCKTRWRVGKWGECHPCKKKGGMAARGVECMQENPERGGDDILVDDDKCVDAKPHDSKLCRVEKPTHGTRKKRCALGLPDKYMDLVWNQLENN